MMLRICRAKARRYIPSLRVGFCSAALQGGIGCKQCRHPERVWNLLDEGSAFGFAVPNLRILEVGSGFALTGAPSFAFRAKGGNGPCSPGRPPKFGGALGNLPFCLLGGRS
jgi:hypothetical protein